MKRTIHRYNYKTESLDDQILEINTAEAAIIGVLNNNTVLIAYYHDDSDKGVIIMIQ